MFRYLLNSQKNSMIALAGGEHRFKVVKTPRDYIMYRAFLDFCYDLTRSNMKWPFDKRNIEFEMLDVTGNQMLQKQEILKFEESMKLYFKELRKTSFIEPQP